MRILQEFEKKGIKYTVFSWNGKISIKCEKDLLEQIYKFRDGSGMDSAADAENFVDENFCDQIINIFELMSRQRYERWSALQAETGTESDFEEII
jgi:hypothetical protein